MLTLAAARLGMKTHIYCPDPESPAFDVSAAQTVAAYDDLDALDAFAAKIAAYPGAEIEFLPEPVGAGPRKHMMFTEPGGIRLELIWPGA